jgi:DNA repair exonuclease SbcCD ATPase subunit
METTNEAATILQLQAELQAARSSLDQKNLAVKQLQTKAQELVRSLDAKYKVQIDELNTQKSALEAEADTLRKQRPSIAETSRLEKALAEATQRFTTAEAAAAGAETRAAAALAELNSLSVAASVNSISTSSISSSSAKIIREEELVLAQQECDAAMAVARSEKKRADEALLAREAAVREAREARLRADTLSQQVSSSATEISRLTEALSAQQTANKRQSEEHHNYVASSQAQAEDRMLELATAISRAEAAEARCAVFEKAEKANHASLSHAVAEAKNAQIELENLNKETNALRQASKASAAREHAIKAESANLSARITRAEAAAQSERVEWAAARQRFEDQLSAKTSERERLIAEAGRLTRQLDEVSVELRAAKAMVDNHGASAQAARNALAAAESRAADAEARYNMQQTSLRSSEGASGRLRADAQAAQEEVQRLKATLAEHSDVISNALKREGELMDSLNDALRRASDAEKEAEAHKKRLDDAEKRAVIALRDAKDDQRKRLEAKTELVSVAQSFEREKAAFASLSNVLTSSLLPKLLSLCTGLRNLLATLDPAAAAAATAAIEANSGNGDMDTFSAASGLDFDADLDAPFDSDDHTMHMKRFASRLKRSLEFGDKNKAGSGSTGSEEASDILEQRISSLLDQAQASTYAATTVAAKLARKIQSESADSSRDNDSSTSSSALLLFTSCLFPPAPPLKPTGRGITAQDGSIISTPSSMSAAHRGGGGGGRRAPPMLATPQSGTRGSGEDASLVLNGEGLNYRGGGGASSSM